MTKPKLTLLATAATLSLTNPASSFAADARMTHICTRKLRLVLRVLLLVWTAGAAGVLGSAQSLAQNAYITNNDLNSGAGDVSVIDTHSNAVIATIPVLPSGSAPAGVAVTSDGSKAYIADESGVISVIDTATNTVSATISVGGTPFGIAVTPDGSRLYVTNQAVNTDIVSVIDTATRSVIATIPVPVTPYGVAVTPDGSKVYVASLVSTSLSVIDVATNTVTTVITVGNAAARRGCQPRRQQGLCCKLCLQYRVGSQHGD